VTRHDAIENGPFDADAFYTALDRARRDRRISWRQVAREAGITGGRSTLLSRLSLDSRLPHVQNVTRLLLWLDATDLAPYLRPTARK